MQQMLFPGFTDDHCSGAVISGEYRYSLWRVWDTALPRAVFIMLNPSTANHIDADATLRRCIGFVRSWSSYGSIEVVNLFALRSAYPEKLSQVVDPIGPENDRYIQQAIERAGIIICAWGACTYIQGRDKEVFQLLENKEAYCLGTTKKGMPRHPLYLDATTPLERYIPSLAQTNPARSV